MRVYCRFILIACMLAGAMVFVSCSDSEKGKADKGVETVGLGFSLEIDKEVCLSSKYKGMPQFAIWLENAKTGDIRTVCVTYKTAKGKWGGEITRPVSLPWWTKKWNTETQTSGEPNARQPVTDAVTAATPKTVFAKTVEIDRGSKWNYFIEVNISGDFNETFAETSKDKHSNGQPSIIYKGTIIAEPGNIGSPEVIARTDQFKVVNELIADMQGITTAKKLLKEIEISCRNISH